MIDAMAMLGRVGQSGFLTGMGADAPAAAPATAGVGGSFSAMLGDAVGGVVETLQRSEAVSMKALSGDADTRQVVDAVMSAEQSLQTAIAIRDKIVSAFLEVSRMAI